MAQPIPIIIARLIDDGVGVPFFRAFSPFEFFAEGNYDIQHHEFIERFYNWTIMNNFVVHRPYHIDRCITPLAERNCTCYFSTYNHMIDNNDMLVDYCSPICFDTMMAKDYASTQPNLIHQSCHHVYV